MVVHGCIHGADCAMANFDESLPVNLRAPDPDTILPDPEPQALAAIEAAASAPKSEKAAHYREIARRWPRLSIGWAGLAENETDVIASYAYARTGYHRGLDALRANGWKGSGPVRWAHPSNRGVLRSIEALRKAAEAIGEDDEAQRCELFLYQLDKNLPPLNYE